MPDRWEMLQEHILQHLKDLDDTYDPKFFNEEREKDIKSSLYWVLDEMKLVEILIKDFEDNVSRSGG